MEKKITDYAHLYAPYCSVILREYNRKFSKWGWCVNTPYHFGLCKLYEFEEEGYTDYQLILRPLSDMSEEERKEADDVRGEGDGCGNNAISEAYEFKYLLSKGFDLFGLIEAGLAIDKTKL